MRTLVIAMTILLVFTLVNAQELNLENLKASHIEAMKHNGHATLLEQRDIKMVFVSCGQGIASACYGETLATAYMEKGNVKVYWYVEKVENGVILTIKLTVNDVTYTRSYKITWSDTEFRFLDLDSGKVDNSRFSIDWDCLKSKLPGCITCLLNWVCWLTCGGSAVWGCINW